MKTVGILGLGNIGRAVAANHAETGLGVMPCAACAADDERVQFFSG